MWIELTYAAGQVAHLKPSMVAHLKNEGVIYGTSGFIPYFPIASRTAFSKAFSLGTPGQTF